MGRDCDHRSLQYRSGPIGKRGRKELSKNWAARKRGRKEFFHSTWRSHDLMKGINLRRMKFRRPIPRPIVPCHSGARNGLGLFCVGHDIASVPF